MERNGWLKSEDLYCNSIFNLLLNDVLIHLQDWDANGCVDFQEFVFAFTSWVNVDDDLEDTTV